MYEHILAIANANTKVTKYTCFFFYVIKYKSIVFVTATVTKKEMRGAFKSINAIIGSIGNSKNGKNTTDDR